MKTLKNSSYLVLIAVLTVVMCLTMAFGTTAFADGDEAQQTDATEAAVIQQEAEAPAAQAPESAQESSTADDQKTSGSEIKDSVNAVNNAGSGALSETKEQTVSVSEDPQDANARQTEQGSDRSQATDAARENSAALEQNDAEEPENDQGSPEGEGTEVKDENTSVESVNADSEEIKDDEAENDGTALEEDAGTRKPDEGNGEDAVNGDSPETENGTGAEPDKDNSNVTEGGEQATAVKKIGEVDLTEAAEEATEGTVNGTIESSFDYSITFTSGDRSTEVTGGQENSLSAILAGLGYEITPETVIEVDQETVDTAVINVTETENGYVLTDNGVFGKANKNLVVYVNGERVEIEVTDPILVNGSQSDDNNSIAAETLQNYFALTDDANIMLTGNTTVTGNSSIVIESGAHDLYLETYTLTDGRDSGTQSALFIINDGATLNVYGFTDYTGAGTVRSGIWFPFQVNAGGTLNLHSGILSSSDAAAHKQTVWLYGGTLNVDGGKIEAVSSSEDYYACSVNLSSGSTLNFSGGVITAEATGTHQLATAIRSTCTNASNTVNISNGTISAKSANGGAVGVDLFYTPMHSSGANTVNLTGGTIIAESGISDSQGICAKGKENANVCSVTISGGEIRAKGTVESEQSESNIYGVAAMYFSDVTITGGTIVAEVSSGSEVGPGVEALYIGENASATVSGGTLKGAANGIVTSAGSAVALGSANVEGTKYASICSNNSGHAVLISGTFIHGSDYASAVLQNDQGSLQVFGGTYNQNPADSGFIDLTEYEVVSDSADNPTEWTVKQKTEYNPGDLTHGTAAGKKTVIGVSTTGAAATYRNIASALTSLSNNGMIILLHDLINYGSGYDFSESVTVSGNLILDLNGHILQHTEIGDVIQISDGKKLILTDSNPTATHNYSVDSATGLWTVGSGSETVSGGLVTSGGTGRGIIINSGSTFIMNGGTIAGNSASNGGGVKNEGTFVMNGGWIAGNTSIGTEDSPVSGGAVFNAGDFTMTGGTITGNRADSAGGIKNIDFGKFTMTGGTVEGNTATKYFGGGISSNGSVIIGGNAKITGNNITTSAGSMTAGNLLLCGNATVSVSTAVPLTEGAVIGISTLTAPEAGSPVVISGNGAQQIKYFTSDNTGYGIVTKNGDKQNLYLGTLVYTLNSDGKTVTAGPEDGYVMTVTDNTLTLKSPAADTLKYDGTAKAAGYEQKSFFGSTEFPQIMYQKKLDAGTYAEAASAAPVDAGIYRAQFTLGGRTASIEFTIGKRSVVLTSASDSKTYDGTALTKSGVTVSGDGFLDGQGATYNTDGSITDAGEAANTFTYTLNQGTDPGNYSVSKVEGKLTVAQRQITVTTSSASKVFDGNELTSGTGNVSGLAGDETVTLNVNGTRTYAGEGANTYSLTWDGTAKESNYSITENLGTLTVTKASDNTVSAVSGAEDWNYGDPSPVLSAQSRYGTVVFLYRRGDQENLWSETVPKTPGYYYVKAIVYETDSYNGAVSSTEAGYQIHNRQLTVKGVKAADKYYDGTTDAIASFESVDGYVSGDDVKVEYRRAFFDNPEIGKDKPVTVVLDITGADKDNYYIELENGKPTASINEPPAPEPQKEENTVTEKKETITVSASTEKNAVQITAEAQDGKATVNDVAASEIAEIVSNANAGENISVDLSTAQQTVTQAALPVNLVKAVATETAKEDKNVGLTVKVTAGAVTLDNTALAAVAAAAEKAETVTVVVEKVETTVLGTAQTDAVQAKLIETGAQIVTAVESFIMADDNKVENLNGGSVKLALSAKAYEGYESSKLSVWQIGADGTMKEVSFTVDENGNLILLADDLGSFVIMAN